MTSHHQSPSSCRQGVVQAARGDAAHAVAPAPWASTMRLAASCRLRRPPSDNHYRMATIVCTRGAALNSHLSWACATGVGAVLCCRALGLGGRASHDEFGSEKEDLHRLGGLRDAVRHAGLPGARLSRLMTAGTAAHLTADPAGFLAAGRLLAAGLLTAGCLRARLTRSPGVTPAGSLGGALTGSLGMSWIAPDSFQQQLRGFGADPIVREANRGQRRPQPVDERHVVEAHYGNVLGAPQPGFVKCRIAPDGEHVVRRGDGTPAALPPDKLARAA